MTSARRSSNNIHDRTTKRIVLTNSTVKAMYEKAEKEEKERLNPPNWRRDMFTKLRLWLL